MRTGGGSSSLPRPQIVKRDTSHQNEQPSIKRVALNRDNSLASNRLKQEYMPEYYNKRFDTEQEVRTLSDNLEHSTLSPLSAGPPRPKPKPLAGDGRVSTMDAITMDLMAKPQRMLVGNRVSTIDALDLDLDDDPIIRPKDDMSALKHDLPKPSSLAPDNRLSTMDFLDLVNEPIVEDDRPMVKPDKDRDDQPLPLNQERNIAEEWMTQV